MLGQRGVSHWDGEPMWRRAEVLYLFGPSAHSITYRIPAVLAGVGTVVMAGWISSRRGRLEALSAMLLVAASYPLIHYSSEARGYAYARAARTDAG